MTTQEIKDRLAEIAAEGREICYTDAGSGSGGPSRMSPDDIAVALASGKFDDVEIGLFDPELLSEGDIDDWHQITWAWDDGDNPYHRIGWIWIED